MAWSLSVAISASFAPALVFSGGNASPGLCRGFGHGECEFPRKNRCAHAQGDVRAAISCGSQLLYPLTVEWHLAGGRGALLSNLVLGRSGVSSKRALENHHFATALQS